MWDELDRKVKAKQRASSTHLCQPLQKSLTEQSFVDLQSLEEKMLIISETVIAAKAGLFNESKV